MKKNWLMMTLVGTLVFILGNLLWLDYVIFLGQPSSTQEVSAPLRIPLIPEEPTASVQPTYMSEPIDYGKISQEIKTATASLTQKVDALASGNKSVTLPPPTSQTALAKELYIPLGTGSTNATAWTDLPGVEAYIAPSNYGKITSMYFEAALRIPNGTGTVYARLLNVTDNNSLFESEVAHEGSTGKLVSSGKVPVPTQTKLYRVQLRSSIGSEVFLDNARIKLFVQ